MIVSPQALGVKFGEIRMHWLLLGWLLATVLIALNRGVGLLWGVAWLLAAALVVGAIYPRLQLRGVRVRRELPDDATVGEASEIRYRLDTGAWPRYGVEVLDRLGASDAPVLATFVERARRTTTLRLAWTPQVRGLRTFGAVELQSRFPLGVALGRRMLAAPRQQVLVYPAAVRLRRLPVEFGRDAQVERLNARERGGRDEYVGSRTYRPGDERRTIDWRATARGNELAVREYERATEREFWIWLELARSAHRGSGRDGTFETMFTIAHSALLRAQADGLACGLVYRDAGGLQRIAAGRDRATVARIRDTLARVEAADVPPLATWIARSKSELPRGGTWLLFQGDATQRHALSAACRGRGGMPLIVAFERESTAPRGARFEAGAWVAAATPGMDLRELF